MNSRHHNGFTLIETLVALLVFSIGILSIAMHTTQSLKSRINTEVHSSVMQIATQVVEPLSQALSVNLTSFEQALLQAKSLSTPPYVQGNDLTANFKVNLARATDANNAELLSTPTQQWKIPFTVIVDVNYVSPKGEALNFSITRILAP